MSYRGISLSSELVIDQLFSLHYFEYMNSFYFPGESHPFWEFVCVDKGDVTIGAGERSFSLTRGQIAFHQPNEFHWVRAGGKTAPCLIVVSFSSPSPFMEFFRGKILHITDPDRRLLAQIVQEARGFLIGRLDDPYQTSLSVRPDAPAGAAQVIRTCLEQFLIGLFRRYASDSCRTGWIKKGKRFPEKGAETGSARTECERGKKGSRSSETSGAAAEVSGRACRGKTARAGAEKFACQGDCRADPGFPERFSAERAVPPADGRIPAGDFLSCRLPE